MGAFFADSAHPAKFDMQVTPVLPHPPQSVPGRAHVMPQWALENVMLVTEQEVTATDL